MSKNDNENKKYRPGKQGIYSADILREKMYKKGDRVYFLLFSYSNPDTIKAFSGEILRHKTNADHTIEYVIRIKNAFEKRELLKDFFHNNWFKTSVKSHDIQDSVLNEGVNMFSFVDHELVKETEDKDFSYGKYKTYFKNNSDKFIFWVNEAFIFDSHYDSMTYLSKLNFMSACKHLKQLHDIVVSKHLVQSASKLYIKNTQQFIQDFKPMVLKIIEDMGPDYEHYSKTNKGIYDFFDDYILNRPARRTEFSKSRQTFVRYYVNRDLYREKEDRD
tara:strand:+ start:106 stop:930 length:825 start_codon:yes stop_codon:yes gene_type:complete